MSGKVRAVMMALIAGSGLMLAGCAATTGKNVQGELLVAPAPNDYKLEITLAKLSEIIDSAKLTNEQRARFLYERGVIYDRLGLRLMARIQFHEALKIMPNLADAYNFMGIYLTQEGDYEAAFEAFDSVLELMPDYDYAYLNRGIAQYYAGINQLAVKDLESFYFADKQDGYRVLWLYIAQHQVNAEQAKAQLLLNRAQLSDDEWSTAIVDYVAGKYTDAELLALAKKELKHPREYLERLCEAYFYMAKVAEYQQLNDNAVQYLRLALATNIYDFVEYRYARVELARLVKPVSQGAAQGPEQEPEQEQE
ncbi:lipoprotein NlpI [Shewanella sp. C32]|uniref:Lipoprotein NlpI n=1 Tax=Shewanella electrica TaxID=515560 RepID=A0ABT2FFB9_9GAMM|nr:lipoprotein NlpI [Shewanella electrica]MCH1925067.1 lipoprotein NlpI [Shewanella electrica]MCS4554891.1 lipoprotein NlpI [Shewanella electrica]